MPQPHTAKTATSTVAVAAVIDFALLIIFAFTGRNSHGLPLSITGVFETALPFLLAAAVGWIITAMWRAPQSLVKGLLLWLITVGGGQLLRMLLQGTEFSLPFFLVSLGVVGIFLVGWRAIAAAIRTLNKAPRSA
ncbi:DUF3054 domain-containing protein [Leucobacter sp. OH2974_COT-288]|uniref:DUF3054 domain-containing protein n=1 Tax=Canibacter oris TaxID=1365628 RepID=A0A840DJ71_9MICO|nr:DUF3054 domain-containing protein [Canibacter oris]MBB4071532.1 hypothetical protein [Canibacter oris]RRD36330.1 DUF3054 domain-containing protein [Leucobacter sp. OH2974_COT-288]